MNCQRLDWTFVTGTAVPCLSSYGKELNFFIKYLSLPCRFIVDFSFCFKKKKKTKEGCSVLKPDVSVNRKFMYWTSHNTMGAQLRVLKDQRSVLNLCSVFVVILLHRDLKALKYGISQTRWVFWGELSQKTSTSTILLQETPPLRGSWQTNAQIDCISSPCSLFLSSGFSLCSTVAW